MISGSVTNVSTLVVEKEEVVIYFSRRRMSNKLAITATGRQFKRKHGRNEETRETKKIGAGVDVFIKIIYSIHKY